MRLILGLLVILVVLSPASAQTGVLRGQVTDQSGAVVPGAKVTLNGPGGLIKTTTADDSGRYSFGGVPPGDYVVQASAPSLALLDPVNVSVSSGAQTLNLQLRVVIPEQKVTVDDNAAPSISTDSGNNASAQVIRGDDLQALSDNPEDLQAELLALAGPSAGPSGGSIFIDGFSGGQVPSKDSIREIRINQNPRISHHTLPLFRLIKTHFKKE